MDEQEFRSALRDILSGARRRTLEETLRLVEYGDSFGDVEFGGWKDLVKVMGGPDVLVRTVLGSLANVSNKARALLSTVAKGLPSIVVPFIQTRYDRIYQAEARRQLEIERMYPEIFTIARKGFPQDGQLFAFMLNPVAMTIAQLGKLGSNIALDMVDALSGQSPDVITRTRPLRRRVGGRDEGLSLSAALLVEADPEALRAPERVSQKGGGKRVVWELLSDRGFQQQLMQSRPVQEIRQRARGMKNQTLNDIIELGKELAAAESVADLQELGLDLGADLIRYETELKGKDLDGVRAVVGQAKREALDLLVKRTQVQLEEFKNLDVPESSDLYRVYEKTISRLKEASAQAAPEKAKPSTPEPTAPGKDEPSAPDVGGQGGAAS